jgi:hypothetical protein
MAPMAYRRSALRPDAPELPAPSMPALAMLEPEAPHLAMRSLDTLVSSCRVLGTWGLQGSAAFAVPDGDSPEYDPGDRIYPDEDTPRTVLRLYAIPITPGHVVGLDVLALPSGPTQYQPTTDEWKESGRGGQIRALVTYYNSDAETVDASAVVTPSASVDIYGAEPASHHDNIETYSATANPFGFVPSMVDRQKFARGGDVLVDVVLTYTGSPRGVDVAIVERPAALVVDQADSEWPSAMYSAGGEPYESLPSEFPVTSVSSSDPGGGLTAVRRALEQHGRQLGPCLAWMTSARESAGSMLSWLSYDDGTGDDEAPAVTSISSTFEQLPFLAPPPTAQSPGFQLGNYARQARDCDEFLDGRTGVLPVWATIYADATAGQFQWRVGVDEWSSINLEVTGAAWDWFIVPGWVEVGVSPDQSFIARLLGRDSLGSLWGWRYAGLFFRQR